MTLLDDAAPPGPPTGARGTPAATAGGAPAGPSATLHGGVLEQLGTEIAAGTPPAGGVLKLDDVERRFSVSRTVAREACRVLESLGLVVSKRSVGAVVQPMTAWHVLDPRIIRWRLAGPGRAAQLRTLTALRVAVEPVAAAEAARRATPQQGAEVLELADRMVATGRAGDLAAFLVLDTAFHRAVLEASGNEMLLALEGVVAAVLAGRTDHDLMPDHPVPEALDLHERVARAVADGDPAAAEAAMRGIVLEVSRALDGPGGADG